MAPHKIKRKSKPKDPDPTGLKTGPYDLEQLRPIIKTIVREERMVTLTLPRSWCQEDTAHIPILSPNALRYIDICVVADSHFPQRGTFVIETGKKKYPWKI